eukprot:Polyplicarium_translucidae@DN3239_c1_g1_i1.p1
MGPPRRVQCSSLAGGVAAPTTHGAATLPNGHVTPPDRGSAAVPRDWPYFECGPQCRSAAGDTLNPSQRSASPAAVIETPEDESVHDAVPPPSGLRPASTRSDPRLPFHGSRRRTSRAPPTAGSSNPRGRRHRRLSPEGTGSEGGT